MSPQRIDNNFEGPSALPPTMRGPRERHGSPAWPQMTDGVAVRECRSILGHDEGESWPTPAWDPSGWIYDRVLMCHRWADGLLSEEERELVRRAREACALEEVGRG